MRRIGRRPHRNAERGAVAILTAVVVGGVMLAVLALTVDVGGMTWERRQMQNSSDAAAMALASFCAEDDAGCTEGNPAIGNDLKPLLNQNAEDNLGQLATSPNSAYPNGYCGRETLLTLCTPQNSDAWTNLRECPPLPDWLTTGDGVKIPYVETYAMTEAKDGTNLLRTFFGGDTTTTHVACARAAWGPPTSYTGTVPLTFSACEWDNFMTSVGSVYPKAPEGIPGYGGVEHPPPWPDVIYEKIIKFQDGDKSALCTDSNGKDGPGGFGDVQPTAGSCEATVTTGGWLVGNNGKSVSQPCRDPLAQMRGTVVPVPVFDCLYIANFEYTGPVSGATSCNGKNDGGSGGTYNYHIVGWAKFYLSGYVFPSASAKSFVADDYPCASSESCISGWFLSGDLGGAPGSTIGPPGSSQDFGAYMVVPAG